MSLTPVTWASFRSPDLWQKFDLDYTSGEGNQLFILLGKFRYLDVEDIAQEFLVENSSTNLEFWQELKLGHTWYLSQKL